MYFQLASLVDEAPVLKGGLGAESWNATRLDKQGSENRNHSLEESDSAETVKKHQELQFLD